MSLCVSQTLSILSHIHPLLISLFIYHYLFISFNLHGYLHLIFFSLYLYASFLLSLSPSPFIIIFPYFSISISLYKKISYLSILVSHSLLFSPSLYFYFFNIYFFPYLCSHLSSLSPPH